MHVLGFMTIFLYIIDSATQSYPDFGRRAFHEQPFQATVAYSTDLKGH